MTWRAAHLTYDFLSFLCAAEHVRLENRLRDISLIFQPGPKDGFRDDNLPPDSETRRSMLWRICVGAGRLLPSVKNFCVLSKSAPLRPDFPANWTAANPVSFYGAFLFKRNITRCGVPHPPEKPSKKECRLLTSPSRCATRITGRSAVQPARMAESHRGNRISRLPGGNPPRHQQKASPPIPGTSTCAWRCTKARSATSASPTGRWRCISPARPTSSSK